MLGLRGRRQQDTRRTFISLAMAAGANVDLLRVVTHGLRQREIMDLYTDEGSLWGGLCAEVVKLKLGSTGLCRTDRVAAENSAARSATPGLSATVPGAGLEDDPGDVMTLGR
jgi:hypothetical protein